MRHHGSHFFRVSQPYLSIEAELHDSFWNAEDVGGAIITYQAVRLM